MRTSGKLHPDMAKIAAKIKRGQRALDGLAGSSYGDIRLVSDRNRRSLSALGGIGRTPVRPVLASRKSGRPTPGPARANEVARANPIGKAQVDTVKQGVAQLPLLQACWPVVVVASLVLDLFFRQRSMS